MAKLLEGKRVAILATDGVEQVELTDPRVALELAGAKTELISPTGGRIQGMNHDKPGDRFKCDVVLKDAAPESYDAFLLPGGVANPDSLRLNPHAVKFVLRRAQARRLDLSRIMDAGGSRRGARPHDDFVAVT
jgi:deglycase